MLPVALWNRNIKQVVMFSQNNGGLANGYLARNNIDPTAGVRFRF